MYRVHAKDITRNYTIRATCQQEGGLRGAREGEGGGARSRGWRDGIGLVTREKRRRGRKRCENDEDWNESKE